MGTGVDLAAVGKPIKKSALLQQAKVSASQARVESTELSKFGWSLQHSDTLEAQTAALESLVGKQSVIREDARVAADTLAIALDETRTYVRKLRAALRPILRALPHGDATAEMFKSGVSLGNAANVSAFLLKIRPGVEKLASQLQSVFPGTPPVQALDDLRAKLDAASTNATVARNRIPELTQAMNEAKGQVMLTLRDLLQFARVAFDAEPQRMGKFYLDLIGGHAPRDTTIVTVTPAAPANPAATTPATPGSQPVAAGSGVGAP
jgi:hypothetical protein